MIETKKERSLSFFDKVFLMKVGREKVERRKTDNTIFGAFSQNDASLRSPFNPSNHSVLGPFLAQCV